MKVKVTVYEQITESFDTVIEIDDSQVVALESHELDALIQDYAEAVRINGDHRRESVSLDEVWFEYDIEETTK